MTCILPSNAPASSHHIYPDTEVSNRVLQERCVNRRDDVLDPEDEDLRRRAFELFEKTEANFITNARHGVFKALDKPLPEVIADSRRLWTELWKCPGFIKYRKGQPKHDCPTVVAGSGDKKEEVKWTSFAEVTFCRAIAAYPAMGKCKVMPSHDNKLRGRNELIADFIEKETGRERGRKQVSSHIQVLKPFVTPSEDNEVLQIPTHLRLSMKYDDKHHRQLRRNHGQNRRRHQGRNISQSSRYVSSYVPSSRHSYPAQQSLPPYSTLGSNVPRNTLALYKPLHFSMFVQEGKDRDQRASRSLGAHVHEFTRFRDMPKLADREFHGSFGRLLSEFPQLKVFSHEELCRTPMISAESTLCLNHGPPPVGAELGIRLEICGPLELDIYENFQCTVRFYEHGEIAPFFAHREEKALRKEVDYDADNKRLNLPFGSDFWATKVIQSVNVAKKALRFRKDATLLRGQEAFDLELTARNLEAGLRESFESLTALQEITAMVRKTKATERLLLICWKFEQAVNNAPGQTTWRNVHVSQIPATGSHGFSAIEEGYLQDVKFDNDPLADLKYSTNSEMALKQPFDPNQSFVIHDFSNMGLPSIAASVGVEQPAQLYTDNDFDFSGGHLHLNLGTQLALPTSIALDNFPHGNAVTEGNMLYDHAPGWQQLSYSDPYFEQNGYVPMRGYEQHDSPFSEAGAQQQSLHNGAGNELVNALAVVQSKHDSIITEPVILHHHFSEVASQHEFPTEPVSTIQNLSPEHALQSVEFA